MLDCHFVGRRVKPEKPLRPSSLSRPVDTALQSDRGSVECGPAHRHSDYRPPQWARREAPSFFRAAIRTAIVPRNRSPHTRDVCGCRPIWAGLAAEWIWPIPPAGRRTGT